MLRYSHVVSGPVPVLGTIIPWCGGPTFFRVGALSLYVREHRRCTVCYRKSVLWREKCRILLGGLIDSF